VEVLRLCYRSGGAIGSRQESEEQDPEKVGTRACTTPQTVARLETGRMLISLEWLFKFCADSQGDPVTLFQASADAVSIVGTLGRTSTVEYIPRDNQCLSLSVRITAVSSITWLAQVVSVVRTVAIR